MTEPKVVLYDFRGNLAEPGEGVFVRLNDYEALAARVQELEEKCEDRLRSMESLNQCADREVVRKEAAWAENRRLREALRDVGVISLGVGFDVLEDRHD